MVSKRTISEVSGDLILYFSLILILLGLVLKTKRKE